MDQAFAESLFGVIGGGLAAALVTIAFSMWWDQKKQKAAEDWEFKRYHANLIHIGTTGLMEAYFSAKTELIYITATLAVLLDALNQLKAQADAIVRQQGGPELTVAALEQRKAQLLQPFETFNSQQVTLRWNQYEQKGKENQAKAEMHLRALQPLISAGVYKELNALFEKLSASFVWDLPHGRERLNVYEGSLPEVIAIREKLMRELEKKLGREMQSSMTLGE